MSKCQVFRENGRITHVEAPNGDESVLYKDLRENYRLEPEQALRYWALAYTLAFRSKDGIHIDKNGEPSAGAIIRYANSGLAGESIAGAHDKPALEKKIQSFLEKTGVSVKTLDSIKDADGKQMDVVAKADLLNRVIEVVEGRKDISTLPEEAAHFFVSLLPENSPMLKDMMSKIVSYDVYKESLDKYKNLDGYRNPDKSINFDMIKKEAIARMISTHIIKQETGNEITERMKLATNWFKRLWDYIVKLFDKAPHNPFEYAAENILAGNVSRLDLSKQLSGTYFQTDNSISRLKDDQAHIQLDNSVDPRTGQKRHIYTYNGTPVKGSVTTVKVDAYYKKLFPNDLRSTRQREIDLMKAEHGDKIHLDAQNIVTSYIDPDTGLKRTDKYINGQVASNQEIYNKLDAYIGSLIDSYEPGTKFFSEVKVYDPKQGIAGSIDLMAIKPDGTVDLYDWKSQEIKNNQTDLKDWKPGGYRIQLGEYKHILEDSYGFKKFGKVRAIPVRTIYEYRSDPDGRLKDIEIGDLDTKQIPRDKSYLLPVTLREEKTGDALLDELVEKLYSLHDLNAAKKVKTGSDDHSRKREEMAKITSAIRDIQVKADVTRYVQLGNLEMNKYLKKLNDSTISKAEVLEGSEVIDNIFSKTAALLEGHIRELNSRISATQDTTTKASLELLKDDINSLNSNATIVASRLQREINHIGVEIAEKNGITNLLTPEKEIGLMAGLFNSVSTLPTASVNAFYKLIRRQNDLRDVRVEKMNKELGELRTKLLDWGAKRGIDKTHLFDGILHLNDKGEFQGELVRKYKKEFNTRREEAIKTENAKWFLDNMDFDEAKYKAAETNMKALYSSIQYATDPATNKEYQEKAFENWKQRHQVILENGVVNKVALFNKKNRFLSPTDEWHSDKWKELNKEGKENNPLKEFYDYIQNMLRQSEDMGMLDEYSPNFVPSIMKGKIEKLIFGDAAWHEALRPDGLMDKLSPENENFFPEADPMTGEVKKVMPVYFKKSLGVERADGSMDYSKMSTDLFKVFSIWGTHMNSYQAMKEIEDDANILVNVEQNKKSLVSNKYGFVGRKGEKLSEKNNNDHNAKILEDFVNYYIYHRANTLGGVGNDKVINVFGHDVSLMKSFRFAMQYFSFKTLGLNPLSGTSQFVGGTGNAYMQAGKRSVFTQNQWTKGMYQLASRDSKAIALLHFFDTFLEDTKRHTSNSLSVHEATKHFTFDALMDKSFVIQRLSDKGVQYPVSLAMMNSHMLEDGKIVSIRDYVKDKHEYNNTFYNKSDAERRELSNKMEKEMKDLEDTRSIYATAKIENDKLVIPGLQREDEATTAFRNKIKKVNKNIIGNATHDDINRIRTSTLGMALMQFRSWIPQMAQDRFGSLKKDADLEAYAMGKTSMFFGEVFSKRGLKVLKSLIIGFGDSGIEAAKARYIREKEMAAIEGRPFDLSEGEFIDLYRGNLYSQLREIMLVLGFGSLVLMGKPGKDEDKSVKGIHQYIARGLYKYYNEFSFYYDPTEFEKLLGNSMPIVGLAQDVRYFLWNSLKQVYGFTVQDDEIMKQAHPAQYAMKLIPIIKNLEQVGAAMDDDFRKENGIKL